MSSPVSQKYYPEVEPKPDLPSLEKKILEFWQKDGTFIKSVEQRPAGKKGANEFIFYDGPPFANGLPHYGHLLTGYVKDVVPRYQTMRGRRVERRFGWDCHGLPAELETEKELGISGRAAIMQHGVEAFNNACRQSVLKYANEWEYYVGRQARWVDFSHDYKTMDVAYMESVMWAFKQLYEKGLLYEGYRVMPYSWAVESPVSNFETRLDNSYRKRQDPSLTVLFELHKVKGEDKPVKLLVWTTTPWTLPSNLALAVGADIDYAIFEEEEARYILAEAAVSKYESNLKTARRAGSLKGQELVGRFYTPLFDFFKDQKNAFQVVSADFVQTDEGTGIVHMAPGFGEDDQVACQANGIDIVCPVDSRGRFTAEVSPYEGMLVFDANKPISQDLKKRGIAIRHETYMHNYPHCWRTDQPLIYKAISSWYVKVTAIREKMVELNQQINWIPGHIRDGQFGKWLEGARDWSISRNRFWGAPIPVWKSDDPRYPRTDVYGSLDELERDFGVRPADLHRPFIDQLTRPNPDDPTGKSTMRRVDDVLDCWFESGSMPFAQVHYPFENKEWFENHFPAHFIVEYIAQTRGWFYTMMVLSTALFEKPPFLNCVCHGVVLDENGQKLSKRLRNYPTAEEVFGTHGADCLRWFLVSTSILRGEDLQIDREGKGIGEVTRRVIAPIWSAYYFFCLYANADGVEAQFRTDAKNLLDRYILAKTRELLEKVTTEMDRYEIPAACAHIQNFIDVLNNWYIRRSRERFWSSEMTEDKKDAYDTLYTVLETLCRIVAPFLPMVSEEIYRGLTRKDSVHLQSWPDASQYPCDQKLVGAMDKVRHICSAGLALRKVNNLRVRLPLSSLTFAASDAEDISSFADLVQDEINVKKVILSNKVEDFCEFLMQVNPSAAVKLGSAMQEVIAECARGNWQLDAAGNLVVKAHVLAPGEFTLRLKPKAGVVGQALPQNDGVVVLDTQVTAELEEEGIARDLVRLVQQSRKDAGLDVSDRIALTVEGADKYALAIEKHRDYIKEQVLAVDIVLGIANGGGYTKESDLQGIKVKICVNGVK